MMGITLKVSFKKKKLQKSLLSSKNTTLTIDKVWYEKKIVPIRSYISCTAIAACIWYIQPLLW